ncbi:MAG: HEPN domain-containing protein [bacterium]
MTVENRIRAIEKLTKRSIQDFREADLLYGEGLYHGAISRAYYSIFHLAQAVLATKNLSRRKHSAVISAFSEHFVKPGLISKEAHSKLRLAFDERQLADYEIEFTKTDDDAKEILEQAKEFSEEIVPYLKKWILENR